MKTCNFFLFRRSQYFYVYYPLTFPNSKNDLLIINLSKEVDYMQVFQKRLKEIREQRDMTQETLGKGIYLSKQEICLYENGKRTPPIDVLIRLAHFLEVDFLWLIGMEVEIPRGKNRIVNLSEEDLLIIEALKKDSVLYEKFLRDPQRAISDISNQLKK